MHPRELQAFTPISTHIPTTVEEKTSHSSFFYALSEKFEYFFHSMNTIPCSNGNRLTKIHCYTTFRGNFNVLNSPLKSFQIFTTRVKNYTPNNVVEKKEKKRNRVIRFNANSRLEKKLIIICC